MTPLRLAAHAHLLRPAQLRPFRYRRRWRKAGKGIRHDVDDLDAVRRHLGVGRVDAIRYFTRRRMAGGG